MTASPPAPAAAPGRIWYLVALVVFLACMAGMAVFLIGRLTAMQDALQRIIVPGERTLALEAGDYTVFHEMTSVIDGKLYSSPGLGGMIVTVTGPGGQDVPLSTSGSGRYTFGGHTGFAVFDFTAPAAGDYAVSGSYDDGADGPVTVIAVGAGFMSSLLGTIFGSLGIAFAGAIIAAGLGMATLIRRRRAGFRL